MPGARAGTFSLLRIDGDEGWGAEREEKARASRGHWFLFWNLFFFFFFLLPFSPPPLARAFEACFFSFRWIPSPLCLASKTLLPRLSASWESCLVPRLLVGRRARRLSREKASCIPVQRRDIFLAVVFFFSFLQLPCPFFSKKGNDVGDHDDDDRRKKMEGSQPFFSRSSFSVDPLDRTCATACYDCSVSRIENVKTIQRIRRSRHKGKGKKTKRKN